MKKRLYPVNKAPSAKRSSFKIIISVLLFSAFILSFSSAPNLNASKPGIQQGILLKGAQHLDRDRAFISDIYSQLESQDGIWSSTINQGEYVRVIFSKNLTFRNDITLYPRTISGKPSIEVYGAGKTRLLANFTPINDNQYNKILLKNLSESQDSFDLRIIGGSVQFDQVIDPTIVVVQIFPDGPGFYTNFTGVVNGTIHWQAVNSSPENDSEYVFANTSNLNETFSLQNITLPPDANITNITVYIAADFWNTTRNQSSIMILSGLTGGNGTVNTNSSVTNKTASPATCSASNCSANWSINPAGGNWNQTTINGLQAGLRSSLKAATAGVNVSQVYVNVTYILDTTPPTVTLNQPADNSNVISQTIAFNATATDEMNLTNMSIYGNWTGAWTLNTTNASAFNNTLTTFNISSIPAGKYIWNVLACDGADNCAFAAANRTFNVDINPPTWSNNQTNTTVAGATVNFSVLINDDISLDPNGYYIFSTNNTGTWVNDSFAGGTKKYVVLTTANASNWTVPSDWNNASNSIICIGGGGGGTADNGTGFGGAGGGGGAYSEADNQSLSGSYNFSVGAGGVGGPAGGAGNSNGTNGGDTWFGGVNFSTSFCGAHGGNSSAASSAGTTIAAGPGGSIAGAVGSILFGGGDGGLLASINDGGSGGGGGGGPHGNGSKGGASQITGDDGGAGGGAADNGAVGVNVSTAWNGSNGGASQNGTAGGIGGYNNVNGTVGLYGSGGGGGGATNNTTAAGWGGTGGNGIGLGDGTIGPGGGGGGGGAAISGAVSGQGGNGGLYGGGGGGDGLVHTNHNGLAGGNGSAGVVIITYTLAGNSTKFTSTPQWANVTKVLNSTVGTLVGYEWYFFDNAGNMNATGILTLTAGSPVLPTVTLNTPADNYNTSSQTIAFNATATDDDVLANMSIYGNWTGSWLLNTTNSSPVNNTLTTFSISSLPEGKYVWNVFACDVSDNCAFDNSGNHTFTVDQTIPTVTLPFYTNLTQKQSIQSLTLNISISDTGSGLVGSACTINANGTNTTIIAISSGWCNSTAIPLTNLANGNQVINVYANDTANNLALNNSYYVQIVSTDTTPPTVSLNSPADQYNTTSQTIAFNATAADNINLTNMSLYGNWTGAWTLNSTNSSPINNTLTTFNITNLPEGKYIWNVLACDNSSNCAFDITGNHTFTVDKTAPTITLPVYTNATIYQNTQNVTFNISVTDAGTGPSYCSINVGGNANQTLAVSSGWCNGTYSLSGLANGNQTINAYANDSLGNRALNNSYAVFVNTTSGIDHVFVIFLENMDYLSVLGNSSAPYLNNLSNNYSLATQYYGNAHPSIGNYFMVTVGNTSSNDSAFSGTINTDNIVRELTAANKTWRDYVENLNYTGGGTLAIVDEASGPYTSQHNPFVYIQDVRNNTSQTNNIVPFTNFSNDLGNNTFASYSFIVPNLTDDAHDAPGNGLDPLKTADNWLKKNIDPLITSSQFQKDGLLVITFDESSDADTSHGGGRVVWVLVGPTVKKGYQSTTLYQHQSTLRMTMKVLGVNSYPLAASSAPDMNEFFISSVAVTLNSPADQYNTTNHSITFNATGSENGPLKNMSIYGNWNGSWIANITNSTPPINGTATTFTVNNISDGKYIWNAYTCDNSSNCAFAGLNNTFTIDSTAPTVTLPAYTNATSYLNTQSLTFNISVTDAGTGPSYCSINVGGNANQTLAVSSGWCNGTYAMTGLSDGNNVINAYSNDTLGNTALNNSYTVLIDNTAPTITLPFYTNLTQKQNTQTLTLNISVSDTGSGLTGSACTINANGTNTTIAVSSGWCNSTSIPLTGLSDGNKTINIYVNDTLNNLALNNSYYVNIFTADLVSPTVTLNTPVDNYNTSSQSIIFNATAADNVNLKNMTLYTNISGAWAANATNSSPINNTQANFTVTGIAEGRFIWNVMACDNSSNCAFDITGNHTFTVDKTAPTITLPVYTNATIYQNTQNVTFNIFLTDAGIGSSYCSVNVNGNTNQTITASSNWCNGTYALTGLADGNYVINAYSNDTLGNTALNNSYYVQIVSLDVTPPTVSLNSPADNYNTSSQTIAFNATASDNVKVQNMSLYGNWTGAWTLNSTNSSPINNTLTTFNITNLPEGKYIWNVLACDNSSNCAFDITGNHTFTVDKTAPTITLPVYTNATLSKNTQNLTVNVFVTDSGIGPNYCTINANRTNTTIAVSNGWCNSTTIALTNLVDGNQTINAYANDSLGNRALNNSYVVQLDSTGPTITVPSNATLTYSSSLFSSFSANDAISGVNTSSWTVNDTTYFQINSTGGLTNKSSLTVKVYLLNISVNDSLGNMNYSIYNVTVNKANLTAGLTNDKAWAREYDGTNSTIGISENNSGDGDVTYTLWRNNTNVSTSDKQSAPGVYSYKINTTGGANYSSADNMDTNTLAIQDATNPLVSVIYPANTTYNSSQTQFNYSASDLLLASCWYTTDNGATNSSPSLSCANFTGLSASEGVNNWTVWANDTSNNKNHSTIAFTQDTQPPAITLPLYTNATIKNNTNTIALNVFATDAISQLGYCTINANGTNTTIAVSNGWCNSTTIALTNLADGNQAINVYANDSVGNLGLNNSYYVKIDSTAPTVQSGANLADNSNRSNSSATFELRGYDNVALSYLQLYGNWSGSWVANQTNSSPINATYWNITVAGIPDGKYTWGAWANDTAGNSAFAAANRTFTIDTTAPYFTAIENQTAALHVPFTYDINATDAIIGLGNFSINDTTNFSINYSTGIVTNATVLSGYYLTNVTVNDTLGNMNWSLWSVNVTPDTQAPTMGLRSPSSGATLSSNTVLINISFADNIALSYCSYNITNSSGTVVNNTALTCGTNGFDNEFIPDGTNYVLTAFANDTSNNTAVNNWSFSIDTSVPVSPGGGSPSGGGPATPPSTSNSTNTANLTVETSETEAINITKDGPGTFTNFSNSSGIDKIEVWVKNAVDNVRINFSVFSSNPQSSSIPNPEKVYQYLHITPENINNSLQNATIKFKVNRSWADNNSIKKENISLFKYFTNISQWEELATIYIGSDKNYYSYETNLSNFSYFAIAGNITANTGKNFFSQIIGDMQSFASSNEGKIILGIILVIIILITVVLSTLVRRLRRDAASSKEVYEKWGER